MSADKKGVTLPEILIALAVAAVALLTLVLFVGVIHRASREGKSQATASTIARTHLERMRSDPAFFKTVLLNTPWTDQVSEDLTPEERAQRAALNFQVSVSIDPLPSNDRYFEGKVQVTWAEEGRERRVRLESYLPDPHV
jgi:prepilin-type N-terminal cleavage/methylation domain-containing protein